MDFSELLDKYTVRLTVGCPYCGEKLYKSRDGFGEFEAVCLNTNCPKWYRSPDGSIHVYYYKLNPGAKPGRQQDLLLTAQKQEALGYYAMFSVFSDDRFSKKDLYNFQADTQEQLNALKQAKRIANAAAKRQPVHGYFFGVSGAGKSHLANGIIISALKLSDYKLRAMFLDWREFIEMRQLGMNDTSKDLRARADKVQTQFSKADLIVLDDLGSERKTPYTADLLDGLISKRTDKPLVITSNLAAPELRALYGERMWRRFLQTDISFTWQFRHSHTQQQKGVIV